jgi:hypothetical protein
MTSYQTPKSLKKANRRLLKENLKLKKKCARLSNANNYFQGNRNGVVRRLFTCDYPRHRLAEGARPSAFSSPGVSVFAQPPLVSAFAQAPRVSAFAQAPRVSAFAQPSPLSGVNQFGNYFSPASAGTPPVSTFARDTPTMDQYFNQMLADNITRVGPSGSLFAQSSQPSSAFAPPAQPSSPVSAFAAFAPQRTNAFLGASAFNAAKTTSK